MNYTALRHGCRYGLFVFCAGLSLPALAATAPPPSSTPPVVFDAQVRFQGVDENNAALGSGGSDNSGLLSTEARLRATVNFNENNLFFWEGRGVAGTGNGGFETSDTGTVATDNNFLEWRQSYLQFGNLGNQPFSIRAGRQKVREPYGDWWNQNFDAVRLAYDSTLFSGFLLGGQDMFSYNSSQDFNDNDKDIARFLASGSWQYHYQQFFETRLMYQDDHSGIASVGRVEDIDNRNDTDGRLWWAGVRAAGKVHAFNAPDKLAYRVDLMGVAGHEDFDTTAANTPSSVIVTGTDGRDVLGWALDAGVDVPLAFACQPLLHLGYAYGSGDGDTTNGTDHAFRQSGLEGNFSRIGGLTENSSNYGTVLRPQLSNIHVLAAGITAPVMKAGNAGVIYHYYRLAEPTTALPSSGVNNTLDNQHRDLGHGIDLLYNMDVSKELNVSMSHVKEIYLRSSLGAFIAGSAYGNNESETAVRGLVELGFDF